MPINYSLFTATRLLVPCSLALFTLSVHALEYGADLRLGSRYEDNATQQAKGAYDLENSIGLGLNASHDTQQLRLKGDYDFSFIQFENNTNDDRLQLLGNSEAEAELRPQRVYWTFSHDLREERSNRSQTNTADDRELRQAISTGPEITLPLTSVDTLLFNAAYSEVFFSSPSDNNSFASDDSTTLAAGSRWQHALSALTILSAGYNYSETERHGDNGVPDRTNKFQTAYLGFNRSLRETQYGLQLGGSHSESDSGNKNDGFYYQADLIRILGDTRLALSASQQLTDASRGLENTSSVYGAFDPGAGLIDSGASLGNFNAEGAVEITSYQANFRSERFCSRCNYSASYSYVESDYDESEATNIETDDREHTIGLEYTHRLNTRLSASVRGEWQQTDFDGDASDIEETGGSLVLRWQASEPLIVSLTGGYQDRIDNTNGGYHNSYGVLNISYQLYRSAQ